MLSPDKLTRPYMGPDLAGRRFGKLLILGVVRRVGPNRPGNIWLARVDGHRAPTYVTDIDLGFVYEPEEVAV